MGKDTKRNFYDLKELQEDVFQGKLSKPHIYNLVQRGEIPTISAGRRLLVPAWYVDKLLGGPGDIQGIKG